jgi:hypothetical protein
MKETLAFINLNCLNCGANLQITENIFEFACQYCGATQIVERTGGIVALKFLSDKIDRVQNSVDKTAAELKSQRYRGELEDLESRLISLDETTTQLKSTVNPIAMAIMVAILAAFLLTAVYVGSIIPLLIGGAVELIVFLLWRKYLSRIDSEFEKAAAPMIERGIELKKSIVELEKIVEY